MGKPRILTKERVFEVTPEVSVKPRVINQFSVMVKGGNGNNLEVACCESRLLARLIGEAITDLEVREKLWTAAADLKCHRK